MPELTTPTPEQVLATPMPDNDAAAATVGGFLIKLLATLWQEQEGFSGKRPFGDSGWEYDVYGPLIRAGFIRGAFDEDGFIEDCDDQAGDALILAAIRHLGAGHG